MKLVTEYLEASAQQLPDKIAFADDKRKVSFLGLQTEAQRLATSLIVQKIFKKPIVILLDKSVECIVAFMGVAYSGNFYTPLDIKMPIDRMDKIIATLQPAVMITDQAHVELAEQLAFTGKILQYETLQSIEVERLAIKQTMDRTIDTDVLYVLFTSGSTGTPKGVIISHRAVIDYIEWVSATFAINSQDVLGNQAPLFFDLSIQDVYSTIKTGCTTYLLKHELFAFPIQLIQYLATVKVNTIFWVPSALCLVANLKALNSDVLPPLAKVLFCGEVMPNKQLNVWREKFPKAIFVNLYGPTEITEACSYYIIDRPFRDADSVPIGKACNNTDILVLNAQEQLVTGNEIGELCVRGTSLAQGYYNNPEKTAEAFVQNPLNKAYQELIYRTGDLVRYNELGELLYVSRKDFQIKHMGHRIELGEIETAISAVAGVETNCCLYDEKRSKIVMFYVGDVDEQTIIATIKTKIPEYMLPNKKVKLPIMPLNLNGKIDRVELKTRL